MHEEATTPFRPSLFSTIGIPTPQRQGAGWHPQVPAAQQHLGALRLRFSLVLVACLTSQIGPQKRNSNPPTSMEANCVTTNDDVGPSLPILHPSQGRPAVAKNLLGSRPQLPHFSPAGRLNLLDTKGSGLNMQDYEFTSRSNLAEQPKRSLQDCTLPASYNTSETYSHHHLAFALPHLAIQRKLKMVLQQWYHVPVDGEYSRVYTGTVTRHRTVVTHET
ncbi:uncharacterized protein PV07_08573 [Cladophialophora immunda]|uniref:Uncharacterized protein n=1 Tax=Cladophialophora immunda TaxID=569365 RepID=A0A0D1ZCC8_9EURO|nr:uncharacterized protein PV07_08573 [Cladophialophora immunda]KIW25396.1 hypothetical protein PV07_08573 [Cladophialophora immunda]